MKKYTYQDWLNGKKPFNRDSGHSEATFEITLGEPLRYYNEYVRNTLAWLHDHEGLLSTADYRKIVEASKEATEAVLQHFNEQLPAFIEKSMKKAVEERGYVDERVGRIKAILNDKPDIELPENKNYSNTLSGLAYQKWKVDNDIEALIAEFESRNSTKRLTEATPPYYMPEEIEIRLLKNELNLLKRKKAEFELTGDKIFDRYKFYIEQQNLSHPKAFSALIGWLVDEYAFDESRDEKRYGIAVTEGAMKKQYQREKERQRKMSKGASVGNYKNL